MTSPSSTGAAALFAALEAATSRRLLQDLPVNAERATQDDTLTIVETFTTGEQYGFAVVGGRHRAARGALNGRCRRCVTTARYDELYSQYFEG